MTKEKIREVLALYQELFKQLEVNKLEIIKYKFSGSEEEICDACIYNHCYWMLDEIEKFLQEDRIEKAMRWLGFIQGVFWSKHVFTIKQLTDHNR